MADGLEQVKWSKRPPSLASIASLKAELDTFLPLHEKEYFDDVVRHKQCEFTRAIAAKRRLQRLEHPESAPRTSLPTSVKHTFSKTLATTELGRTMQSSQSAPTLTEEKAPPTHETSLELDHMLEREVHAEKHRKAMELFMIKLESEAAMWKKKYADEVVHSMESAATAQEAANLRLKNAALERQLKDAIAATHQVQDELESVQAALATTQRTTQALAMDVLDQTRLTNNEFEERLVQEQLTSAELRDVVQQCMRRMDDLTRKELDVIATAVAAPPPTVDPRKRSSRRTIQVDERPMMLRGSADYMLVCPWMIYGAQFRRLNHQEALPLEFQERMWRSRSDAFEHERWVRVVTARCSLEDSSLRLWDAAAVLDTTISLWLDKRIDDLRRGALKLPPQSLPKFASSWFLHKYKDLHAASAQLYLYTVGLVEHKAAHARVQVMAALLGLTNVKCYLPRLADCALRVLTTLVPLQSLAGILASSTTRSIGYDLPTVESALADVFSNSADMARPFDRVQLSPESRERLAEILTDAVAKARHHAADDDGNTSPRNGFATHRTTTTTSSHSSMRRRTSAKRIVLPLEVVLELVVHVWFYQTAQDMDAFVDGMLAEDSSETMDYGEFKSMCVAMFPREFHEHELLEIYETAAALQAYLSPEQSFSRVEIRHLARMLLARGYTYPATRK
ncbi:hypothetical protein LEN26_009228 [Aphanomyces euteiches]|nr:hypothetical protein LEN26_009228 [Aphanomyces euteiches]